MDNQDRHDPELAGQRREERMRYEVLAMAYRALRADPGGAVDFAPAVARIGAWRDELLRVLHFLDRAGLVRFAGPGLKVCVTPRAMDYLGGDARLARAIPDRA